MVFDFNRCAGLFRGLAARGELERRQKHMKDALRIQRIRKELSNG